MNTGQRNSQGRVIFRGPRGGEYVLGAGGRKIRSFTRATAPAESSALTSAKAHMNTLTTMKARKAYLRSRAVNMTNANWRALGKYKNTLNYRARAARGGRAAAPAATGNRNTQGRVIHRGPRGGEYVLGAGGRKIRTFTRATAAPVAPRRSSPELLNNMLNQIYVGGRGGTVNAGRYTNAEKNVLARRLSDSIEYLKDHRNIKKAEAAHHRAVLRSPGLLTNAQKQTLRNQAAAANERVGYYDDAVRAYTRGLRALKPLTGVVTPRAHAMPNTPNRSTPAPANVNMNAIYMPLNRPHLVVKTPGVGTIYLNPNTFTGFMKNAGRVTIAPANVRNWLRMARRDFPNEALFRHPLAPKNVTASHIRFSRA